MNIAIITGSRADFGLLEWPLKVLREDSYFKVAEWRMWGATADQAMGVTAAHLKSSRPDVVMLAGDRFEIMAAAMACHLERVPVAHLCGGDVTEGSYDDAMRDCISRMASIHFVTSTSAMARLTAMGLRNIHLTGSTGIDFIKHGDWKNARPIAEPYVVVSYQAETIDRIIDWTLIDRYVAGLSRVIYIMPNVDSGSAEIRGIIERRVAASPEFCSVHENLAHADFLNLIYHSTEFIGNSSAMLYEAPEMGVKTRMIGKRQRGRVIPWGDGNASLRIAKALKYGTL